MKESQTYPLRLPRSLKEAVARLFADRKARADFEAFDKIMRRRGGSAPREGDEVTPSAK